VLENIDWTRFVTSAILWMAAFYYGRYTQRKDSARRGA